MPKVTRADIENWIEQIPTGEFHYKEILDGRIDPANYGLLRKYLHDICHSESPICESVGRRDGYYRVIENHAAPIDWQTVETKQESGIILPFNLRDYVHIYPDTTVIVAGAKSSGKTGFLYRSVVLNMNNINTELLTNLEGGIAMLRDRFNSMDAVVPVPAPFKVRFVYENFHDYIKLPNTLYVIDYIDAPDGSDFYMIGAQVKKIDQKLQGLNSNAIIGLQKPSTRDIAFGGEQTLKVASLYLAMDNSKLKIVDAKVPANKTVSPRNMQWTFLYDEAGTNFINIQQDYGDVD